MFYKKTVVFFSDQLMYFLEFWEKLSSILSPKTYIYMYMLYHVILEGILFFMQF
jgi:hypothetical protein